MCIVSVCMSVFVLPVCLDPRQLEDGIRCLELEFSVVVGWPMWMWE